MIKKFVSAAGLAAFAALSGCASIVDGTNQSLSVATTSPRGDVSGASCALSSNKGTWFVETPGTVTVHRGYDPLNIKCTKDGYQPAIQTAQSSTKPMAFGNVVFGGVIGAGVDMGTGAAYDYPQMVTVMMQPDATTPAVPIVRSASQASNTMAAASK